MEATTAIRHCLTASTLALLAASLLSCGGSSSTPTAPGDSDFIHEATPPSEAPPGTERQILFPVRMNPQTPVQPSFRTTSAALPDTVPLPSTGRRTSGVDPITVPAASYRDDLPHNRIEAKNDYLQFTPLWHDWHYDTLDDAAYCTYQVDLEGYTGIPTIGFEWAENGMPRVKRKFWVALSDWEGSNWRWYEGPLDKVLTVDDLSPLTDEYGEMLIMIVMFYREHVAVLRNLVIGTPEQRGTGYEYEDIELLPTYPALYVAPMPSSVDLTPGCAPINDQGTWGSCTAFAVGDGAYNYELNKIYQGLGWTLAEAANRVSPKFVYVESGKRQGWPPGGDYGRYTDQVAQGLMVHGAATELNAPYDLVYDDNWTAAALADAQLLKTNSYTGLSCTTQSGIDSIKAVLAHQLRPVLVSTQVDLGLFYYEPGTVWDFTGPSFGGHAMLLVGYDDARSAFKVRNSWGPDWGDDGYLWMSYDSLMHPYNWYVQCGYIRDEYDPQVSEHFLGSSATILPPSGLAASDGSGGQNVELAWQPASGATGYRIYRDTSVGIVAELGAVTAYTDSAVGDNLAHMYWVSALQGAFESELSAPDLGYVAQTPEIVSLSPQGGAEGQQLRFIPEVRGDSSIYFSWSFGGGAEPNTSFEAGPTVVLGEEGAYDAMLMVGNANGADVLNWTLEVSNNRPPVIYVDRYPQEILKPPVDVTLDATPSVDFDGFIVLYEWDTNADGNYDITETGGVLEQTYTEAGSYSVKLRIMDDAGQYDTKVIPIVVLPPNEPPVAAFSSIAQGGKWLPPVTVDFGCQSYDPDGPEDIVNYEWDLDGDGIYEISDPVETDVQRTYTEQGFVDVRHRVTDQGELSDVKSRQLEIGYGQQIEGWEIYAIGIAGSPNAGSLDAAVIDGKPAITLLSDNTDQLFYYASSVSQPTAASDWSKQALTEESQAFGGGLLTEAGGLPAVCYRPQGSTELRFMRDNGAGNWVDMSVHDQVNQSVHYRMEIETIDGRPVIGYFVSSSVTPSVTGLWYARSNVALPVSSANWTTMQVVATENDFWSISVNHVSDIPMVAAGLKRLGEMTRTMTYAYASSATPSGSGDWSEYELDAADQTAYSCSLTTINAAPAVAYMLTGDPGELRIARATTGMPGNVGEWGLVTFDITPVVPEKQGISMLPIGGIAHILYDRDDYGDPLGWCVADSTDPQAADDWTVSALWDADCRGRAVIEVGGKPALVIVDSNKNYLLYAYPAS